MKVYEGVHFAGGVRFQAQQQRLCNKVMSCHSHCCFCVKSKKWSNSVTLHNYRCVKNNQNIYVIKFLLASQPSERRRRRTAELLNNLIIKNQEKNRQQLLTETAVRLKPEAKHKTSRPGPLSTSTLIFPPFSFQGSSVRLEAGEASRCL